MEQVSKDVETNMSQEQINALIKYQLNNNATWTIQSIAAEGTNTKESSTWSHWSGLL